MEKKMEESGARGGGGKRGWRWSREKVEKGQKQTTQGNSLTVEREALILERIIA